MPPRECYADFVELYGSSCIHSFVEFAGARKRPLEELLGIGFWSHMSWVPRMGELLHKSQDVAACVYVYIYMYTHTYIS